VLVLEWFLISILLPFKQFTKSKKKKPKRRKKTKQEKRLATPMAEPQEERMVQGIITVFISINKFDFDCSNSFNICSLQCLS
jgi:hypothetical protein